jgi:hypothetical protein
MSMMLWRKNPLGATTLFSEGPRPSPYTSGDPETA